MRCPTLSLCLATAASITLACDSGTINPANNPSGDGPYVGDGGTDSDMARPVCPNGDDSDGDGYGEGCEAGKDCDDSNEFVYPGAKELCDGRDNDCDGERDEGVLNACGNCSSGCKVNGDDPFELEPVDDPNVQKADGVGLNGNGDIILDQTKTDFNFMWIANTDDYGRGTVSKIDTLTMTEVARYYSVTCNSTPAADCVDLHGKPVLAAYKHKPSRTAVDYNFDVWVANRAFDGQASATKIANSVNDCIDRNGNGTIETSRDLNGDGKIETDCDGNTGPDNASTTCTNGGPPEFVGEDDECVLFTVNYGDKNDVGRSICLDRGIDKAASNAWVGTNDRSTNRFYKIDGQSGQLHGPYDLPSGHAVYGCVVDSQGILWSVATKGTLNYLHTIDPTKIGPLLKHPFNITHGFYGIALDSDDHLWMGGYISRHAHRYKPDRTTFETLNNGTWTSVEQPSALTATTSRGIAADHRGKIWVALTSGYIWRIDQSTPDGLHPSPTDNMYWKVSGSDVIGAGVDFKGHIWGVSRANDVASRLDVDSNGDVIDPPTGETNTVPVGNAPYTYSDFTGFGLRNFTRPQGTYIYRLEPCDAETPAQWESVQWEADVPPSTSLLLRVRSGDTEDSLGDWFGPYDKSPAELGKKATNKLVPNPSRILEMEFTLESEDKQTTPVLKSFSVTYSCNKPMG